MSELPKPKESSLAIGNGQYIYRFDRTLDAKDAHILTQALASTLAGTKWTGRIGFECILGNEMPMAVNGRDTPKGEILDHQLVIPTSAPRSLVQEIFTRLNTTGLVQLDFSNEQYPEFDDNLIFFGGGRQALLLIQPDGERS